MQNNNPLSQNVDNLIVRSLNTDSSQINALYIGDNNLAHEITNATGNNDDSV